MTVLFKALTRPSVFMGVPVTPFFIVVGLMFLLGVYTTKLFWLLIPIAVYTLKLMAKKDDHIFHLWFLKLKMKGNAKAKAYYHANSLLVNRYDDVDVGEFVEKMKLNERTTIDEIIPYSSHVDDYIVKTKQTDLVSTWIINGTPFECRSNDELKIITDKMNTVIKSFSGEPVTFYTHNTRESFYDAFKSTSDNYFANKVSNLYYQGIKQNKFKINTIYFTVCYKPFFPLERNDNKRLNLKDKRKVLEDAIGDMQEIRARIFSTLAQFGAQPLGVYEENKRVYSSQLSFYHYLITGVKQKISVTTTPFYSVLGGGDVFFSTDSGQINTVTDKKFFRSIEIKDFVSQTATGIFNILLYSDCHYVITQSFTVMSKSETLAHIKDVEKKMRSTEDDALSQRDDLVLARDGVTSGEIAFGKYHFSLFVYADSLQALIKDTNKLASHFIDMGMIVTLSSLSLPAAFCAQLPGVYQLRPRLSPISSQNYAEIASFHNFYTGKRDLNPWGEAIAILKTPSRQPYYLNLHNVTLHKNEMGDKTLANTSVIGTAGSGKTMLLSFLAVMVQKYACSGSFSVSAKTKRLTTVFLDKDRGAELNIRALGGRYYRVKQGAPTGWNPFRLPKNKRNGAFIKSLMKLLCCRNGETLSSREEIMLSDSVDAVMTMPDELRAYGITRLIEHMTEAATRDERENGMMIRLSQWSCQGQFGWVFDNENDTFDVNEGDNFGIDGSEFLDDKDICTPISFYLLHRVSQLLDGRRMIIFLDEFWKWLGNDAFSDFVYNKLKTIRKLNGLVIPATQSPDEILKHPISKAVIEVCGTQIYLANPQADYKDYVEGFKVTKEEFDIIKSLDPLSHAFLIKKSSLKKGDNKHFSALVTLDLSSLGVYTKILSSSVDNLEIFDALFTEELRPKDWLEVFIKKAI